MRAPLFVLAAVLSSALAACHGSNDSSSSSPVASVSSAVPAPSTPPAVPVLPPPRVVKLSLAAQVGAKMFFDPQLSGSGKMSCATCHDPDSAFGPPNDLSAQLGGVDLDRVGTRAAPSLRYKNVTPPYSDLLDNPDGISVPGPGGGFAWDGRAGTLAEQAAMPMLDANEMANPSAAEVVAKLHTAPYADLFKTAFGAEAFASVDDAFKNAGKALEAFQLEERSFHPATSQYDLYAGNKIGGKLTVAEARGMKVFTDPNVGNCASCHYQGGGFKGTAALFTDFSYEAIGVPRNRALPANADPKYFDLGLCGPLRTDHPPVRGNTFCGMFKAPTLRNVATRKSFFHNGVMHSLEQVIRFYNTRDTMPEIWYPTVGGKPKAKPDASFPTYGLITTQYIGGKVRKFDDLPAQFKANIDPQMPQDGRPAHSKSPMSEQNIADLICFLNTLTDGYKPPAAPPTSGPCIN
jgi:cytochrome c peroxidase